jgi:hypothetical protein
MLLPGPTALVHNKNARPRLRAGAKYPEHFTTYGRITEQDSEKPADQALAVALASV